ncbi:MAG: PSD1 domain-containing protein [Verrucomicrobia bacterium]|nr:PSD1 domain-containing protein [Verrucomicrobiota bacterium]
MLSFSRQWISGLAVLGVLKMLAAEKSAPPTPAQLAQLPPAAKLTIDFARDIQPLFIENCLKCHGPEKQKSGLRLDVKTDALRGGDSGLVIVPGKSAESALIHLVAGLDADKIMPPKGERLTPLQIGLLRAWIDQGANWPDSLAVISTPASTNQHWAFQAPLRREPQPVKNSAWVRNAIDQFVLARLENEKIKPSPEAARTTLIRRLSLDLTGLPPTPAEVKAFLNDPRPDVYERLVDRLLASPHFGEQWARHWLDLARYADTDGYEKDYYRPHAWRWRDWVINSINHDQPFDEFTRDQIAGDLLPNASLDQRVATGFHRNTLLNREGGVDIEEDRCKIVVDRVSTVGATWLGLTVGCAECHSHKYDPISQKEFYQLYAFFNSTDDRDIRAPLPEQLDNVRQQESKLDVAKKKYAATLTPEVNEWAKQIAALPEIWFTPAQADYDLPTFGANNGANLYPQEDGSFLVTGMIENKTHYIMMLNTRLKGITGIRVEAMTDEMLPQLGPGWSANGNFVLTEVYVESASLKDMSNLKSNALQSAVADYSQPGFPINETIDGVLTNGGWAVDMPGLPMHAVDRCAVFTTQGDIGYDAGTRLKVSLVQNRGQSHTLGRVRVTYTTAPRESLAAQAVPQRIRDLAKIPEQSRTLDQRVTLKRYYDATFRADSPALAEYTAAMTESPGVKGEVQTQTLAERRTLRATHIHVRGNFLDHGPEVKAGVLTALHAFKPRNAATGADRVDLANWLTSPENPLTARVTVNHLWRQLFGQGLVATMADFGSQGDKPTHPELLDWLATEFIKQKWSRKAMIKLIVTSAAYRQASDQREDLLAHDAKNKLLARQNRFRLSAENARDQYLAASGLLDERIGGGSVDVASKRRGLYLKFIRAFPEYMLTTFDAPASTQACPMRERSNTPLQALTLLNDKLFFQCAQALAQRALRETAGDNTNRIAHAFQLCTARSPTTDELADLAALLHQLHRAYEAEPQLAEKIAGAIKVENTSSPEFAAWTVLARTILNLDEVITRE